jgi:hypothetical protein
VRENLTQYEKSVDLDIDDDSLQVQPMGQLAPGTQALNKGVGPTMAAITSNAPPSTALQSEPHDAACGSDNLLGCPAEAAAMAQAEGVETSAVLQPASERHRASSPAVYGGATSATAGTTGIPTATRGEEPHRAITPSPDTVPVTVTTLRGRIKRALGKGKDLKRVRGPRRGTSDVAGWYVIDVDREECLAYYKELEVLAKELGVMKRFEHLVNG